MKIEIVVSNGGNAKKKATIIKEIMELVFEKYHQNGFEFQYSHHNADRDDDNKPLHYAVMHFNNEE